MHGNMALWSAEIWIILGLAAGHLTEEQKSIIVDMHNDLRSRVQPTAAFMQKVVWDETVRLVAEGHAARCIWDHNPEREGLSLGESLFVTTESFNVTKAMLDWFNEQLHYDYDSNFCAEDETCAHYTQMVWADSRKIGCATHLCETLEGLDFEKATLLVCNYFPRVHFEEKRPYEAGKSCSRCPEGLPVCEHNICVAENFFSSEEPESETTEHPAVSINHPTTVPGDPTEGHRRTEETGREREVTTRGSDMQRTSSALLLVVFILTAVILR